MSNDPKAQPGCLQRLVRRQSDVSIERIASLKPFFSLVKFLSEGRKSPSSLMRQFCLEILILRNNCRIVLIFLIKQYIFFQKLILQLKIFRLNRKKLLLERRMFFLEVCHKDNVCSSNDKAQTPSVDE